MTTKTTLFQSGTTAIASGAGAPPQWSADGSELDLQGRHVTRQRVDLTGIEDVRLTCNVWDITNDQSCTLSLEYHDQVEGWQPTGVELDLVDVGLHVGSYVEIPPELAQDLDVRIVVSSESGVYVQPMSIELDSRE